MRTVFKSLIELFGFQGLTVLQSLACILLSAAMLSGLWVFIFAVFAIGDMYGLQ